MVFLVDAAAIQAVIAAVGRQDRVMFPDRLTAIQSLGERPGHGFQFG
jgi:hypothetical protein